jgi:hypothetical protein
MSTGGFRLQPPSAHGSAFGPLNRGHHRLQANQRTDLFRERHGRQPLPPRLPCGEDSFQFRVYLWPRHCCHVAVRSYRASTAAK